MNKQRNKQQERMQAKDKEEVHASATHTDRDSLFVSLQRQEGVFVFVVFRNELISKMHFKEQTFS